MEFQHNAFVEVIEDVELIKEVNSTTECSLINLKKCKHIHAILNNGEVKRVYLSNLDLLYGLSYLLTALSHEEFITTLEKYLSKNKVDYRVLQLFNDIYSYGIDSKKMSFDPLVWQTLLTDGNKSINYVGTNVSPATYENELSKLKSSLSTLQDYAIGLFTQKWLRQVDGVEQAVSILKLIYTNQ